MRTLTIYAHSRDCNSITVVCEDGRSFTNEGYVPRGLGIGGGDDVTLTIDIETGSIIGWDAERVREELTERMSEDCDRNDRFVED